MNEKDTKKVPLEINVCVWKNIYIAKIVEV